MSYFVIFPGGDRSKISVLHLTDFMRYELNDYAVASRNEWTDDEEPDAIEYAKKLAREHNKEYIGDDDGYLD